MLCNVFFDMADYTERANSFHFISKVVRLGGFLTRNHHYIKPCFTVLRIDFFHFNSSAGSFYKDEKVATTAEFEIVSSEIP